MNFVGQGVLTKTVDMPAIIASGALGYSPLAVSGLRTAVPSTGVAVGDTLQLFRVPLGTLVRSVGMRITTVNALACTICAGNASATQTHLLGAATAGMMSAHTTAAAATFITEVGASDLGADTVQGLLFITNGTIDLLTAGQVWLAGIIDFWADVVKVF